MIGNSGSDEEETAAADASQQTVRVRRQSDRGEFDEGRSRRSRPDSTVEAMREPGQLARMQGLIDLYAGMGPEELAEEVDKLDALPFGDRILASVLLFSRGAEVDPLGALEQTDKMGMGGMFAKPTVLRSWASMDPVNAAKYFEDNPSEFARMGRGRGPGGDSGSSVIAREWAKNQQPKHTQHIHSFLQIGKRL